VDRSRILVRRSLELLRHRRCGASAFDRAEDPANLPAFAGDPMRDLQIAPRSPVPFDQPRSAHPARARRARATCRGMSLLGHATIGRRSSLAAVDGDEVVAAKVAQDSSHIRGRAPGTRPNSRPIRLAGRCHIARLLPDGALGFVGDDDRPAVHGGSAGSRRQPT